CARRKYSGYTYGGANFDFW
nr:immunoglobulin heavy chain junction region [Macaca mulatta]MOX60223.1 immunoglobulin heavy chain junction region [Macaca mulatta]MOX60316.1 immunoglobulin heavy chain junction region [Macaca mulatta]MOX62116.1 immunoglobulin heavy chain junction region [Macaca mulatta]MOX63149.1 immunoglobulin heavy chain junction region [Macaca mulatta]